MRWRGSIPAKCRSSKCASLADSAWKRRPKCSKYRPLPCGASGAPPRFGSTASWRAGQAMDSERWKQLDRLLQSVLERPPEERDAFLRQACAGDEALEREVRSLLTLEREAGSFLESPAIEVAALALARRQSKG